MRARLFLWARYFGRSRQRKEQRSRSFFIVRKCAVLRRCCARAQNSGRVKLLDAAYWVKGCSSLGRLRYAALLEVGGKKKGRPDYCLLDLKEAVRAAAPRAVGVKAPIDQAERVVEGCRRLPPYLGKRMRAVKLMSKSVFVRELLPQDLKIEIENLTREEAQKVAHYLAAVVGNAHRRQMDAGLRRQW